MIRNKAVIIMSENNKIPDTMINTIKNKVLNMLDEDIIELMTLLDDIRTGNLDREKLGKMYLQTKKFNWN